MFKQPALIVAGPTCSGKSAFALMLAERFGGAIINADAMQVYRELRVLTARPTPDDETRAPHLLYGVRPAAEISTVAWWREACLSAMDDAAAENRVPILCGGTGLYLGALGAGLAAIPETPDEARHEARALIADLGPAALHEKLARVDPETAARLRPSDSQRLARAWEVWRGTGRGLAAWQTAQPGAPALPWRFCAIILDPPRDALRAAIATRFDAMLAQGALDEVRALLAQDLPPSLPAMRAHGVPELSAYLRGDISLAEAANRARLVTGQYTKRQATWFRHRHIADEANTHRFLSRYDRLTQFSENFMAKIVSFIRGGG